ncbi:hypothetical protein C4D60_Mb08t23740 [Musa balbisiana]|uniref:Uncharacterized protein n=1 Tax=Musa balbisiana TaxID=52838 RepID=A0A4S8K611_MUSBA|nr:hypothetical protein C4D60_Mb08t23740 [Musa balbisiana]
MWEQAIRFNSQTGGDPHPSLLSCPRVLLFLEGNKGGSTHGDRLTPSLATPNTAIASPISSSSMALLRCHLAPLAMVC